MEGLEIDFEIEGLEIELEIEALEIELEIEALYPNRGTVSRKVSSNGKTW